jgi:hypothetical protein
MCTKNKNGSIPNLTFVMDLPDGNCLVEHSACGKEHPLGECPEKLPEIFPEYASW